MRPRFSFKIFTSFLLLLTFLTLILSGAMLFLSPPGRIAHWTNWTMIGLTKEGWLAVHVLMSVVFLVGGLFHLLKFNWGAFLNYLRARRESGFRFRKEMITALVLFMFVLFGTLFELPPFATIVGLSGESASWNQTGEGAPVPHLELETLERVAGLLKITSDRALSTLQNSGLKVSSAQSTLKQIADANDLSPREVYALLPKEAAPEAGGVVPMSGLGQLTLDQLSERFQVDMVQALKLRGIEASGGERFRSVAERAGVSPHDLLEEINGSRDQ